MPVEVIEYIEVGDNSGHSYVIPFAEINDWYEWLEIDDDDERAWDVPEYAKQIDGGSVIFTEWRIG